MNKYIDSMKYYSALANGWGEDALKILKGRWGSVVMIELESITIQIEEGIRRHFLRFYNDNAEQPWRRQINDEEDRINANSYD